MTLNIVYIKQNKNNENNKRLPLKKLPFGSNQTGEDIQIEIDRVRMTMMTNTKDPMMASMKKIQTITVCLI